MRRLAIIISRFSILYLYIINCKIVSEILEPKNVSLALLS